MNAVKRLQMELSLYGIEPVAIRSHSAIAGYVIATLSFPSDTNISMQLRCIKGGKQKLLRSPDTLLNDQVVDLIADYYNPEGERYVADGIDKAYYHLPDLLHDLGLIPSTNN